MSSSQTELLRAAHEDIESYERHIVALLEQKPKTNRERVLQSHRVANLINDVVDRSKAALTIYNDKDGVWKDELNSMRGSGVFTSFYDRLKETKEYHKKFPNLEPAPAEPDVTEEMNPNVQFSGEEVFGKYIDLHRFYERYCNLPALRKTREGREAQLLDYQTYVQQFADLSQVPASQKISNSCREYIKDLLDYLVDFFERTNPLADLDEVMTETQTKFKEAWVKGEVAGWENETPQESYRVDLSLVDDVGQLMELGLEDLKKALIAEGLKCGGSLRERAERLYSIKDLPREKIPKKIRSKDFRVDPAGSSEPSNAENGGDNQVPNGAVPSSGSTDSVREEVALLETKLRKMCELLQDVVEATVVQVEKKQTRTREELEAEILEEEEGALADVELMDQEEEEDDVPFYNPLNLPLGWDGKPIPYWLYKLHGLGVEYKCEICGNHSYWGRRAFDRHFQEWRHAHGMRCLKIPNTKHFHDITLIEDAINLYEKIKGQLEVEQFDADHQEEFEDSEGNVLSRKTFEDLARQGLL